LQKIIAETGKWIASMGKVDGLAQHSQVELQKEKRSPQLKKLLV
jgi:hypothetical protein